MKKLSLILTGLLACTTLIKATTPDIRSIVRRGNIVSTNYDEAPVAGRYIGNGRFGTVLGPLGLNLSPQEQASRKTGASHITHLQHWGRFQFISAIEKTVTSADYNLPVMKIHWDGTPEGITAYRQEQDFYDGTVTTAFTTSDGTRVQTQAWFDYELKDLACFSFTLSGGSMDVRTTTISGFQAYSFVFRDIVDQETLISRCPDGAYKLTVTCPQAINNCSSDFYIYTNAEVRSCSDGLRFHLKEGRSDIFISYGAPLSVSSRKSSLKRSTKAWHTCWANTGWMCFPDEAAQKVWVRSMAYMLESLDDFATGLIQPDNGFTGNPFPFHFVQDLEYIAPALMMTGHGDIVMKWVEHFAGEIENMKAYAKKLWPESEGIYPPWELPFGSVDGYHHPTVPVAFCYEPHNSGYLARLAKEAADFNGNTQWAQKYAYPLIREVCEFYRSAARKHDDGLWHMNWYPCIGQDEAGGRNKTDYLCSIYSAEYSFKAAVELGLDSNGNYAAILHDGLAYKSLEDKERGTLHTCTGVDDFGKQKHPVQLDGLAYFPIQDSPLQYEVNAYNLRHDITQDARKPKFYGWTLGQFLLSGSNMKDSKGWLEDWNNIIPSDYADPDLIQIYETSGNPLQSFYITTHGMVQQSLIRNYVNDYWGELDIAGCPVFEGRVSFGNIDTRLGVRVSGVIENSRADIKIKALKTCTIRYQGMDYSLKKGQTIKMKENK